TRNRRLDTRIPRPPGDQRPQRPAPRRGAPAAARRRRRARHTRPRTGRAAGPPGRPRALRARRAAPPRRGAAHRRRRRTAPEHDGRRIAESTAKCVACALEIAPGAVDIVVFSGPEQDALAAEAATLAGVSRVLRVIRDANGAPLAAVLAPQLAAVAERYTHVL